MKQRAHGGVGMGDGALGVHGDDALGQAVERGAQAVALHAQRGDGTAQLAGEHVERAAQRADLAGIALVCTYGEVTGSHGQRDVAHLAHGPRQAEGEEEDRGQHQQRDAEDGDHQRIGQAVHAGHDLIHRLGHEHGGLHLIAIKDGHRHGDHAAADLFGTVIRVVRRAFEATQRIAEHVAGTGIGRRIRAIGRTIAQIQHANMGAFLAGEHVRQQTPQAFGQGAHAPSGLLLRAQDRLALQVHDPDGGVPLGGVGADERDEQRRGQLAGQILREGLGDEPALRQHIGDLFGGKDLRRDERVDARDQQREHQNGGHDQQERAPQEGAANHAVTSNL